LLNEKTKSAICTLSTTASVLFFLGVVIPPPPPTPELAAFYKALNHY